MAPIPPPSPDSSSAAFAPTKICAKPKASASAPAAIVDPAKHAIADFLARHGHLATVRDNVAAQLADPANVALFGPDLAADLARHAERMDACSPWIAARIAFLTDGPRVTVANRRRCKSPLCPICNDARKFERASEFTSRIAPLLHEMPNLHAVAFTVGLPRAAAKSAPTDVARVSIAFRKLTQRNSWPSADMVRSIEAPFGSTGLFDPLTTNVHVHALALLSPSAAAKFTAEFIGAQFASAVGEPYTAAHVFPLSASSTNKTLTAVWRWVAYGAKGPMAQATDAYFDTELGDNAPISAPLMDGARIAVAHLELRGLRLLQGHGRLSRSAVTTYDLQEQFVGASAPVFVEWSRDSGRYLLAPPTQGPTVSSNESDFL